MTVLAFILSLYDKNPLIFTMVMGYVGILTLLIAPMLLYTGWCLLTDRVGAPMQRQDGRSY